VGIRKGLEFRNGFERDFAKGDAAAGGEIDGLIILDDPAALEELRVDLPAGGGFGRHTGREECKRREGAAQSFAPAAFGKISRFPASGKPSAVGDRRPRKYFRFSPPVLRFAAPPFALGSRHGDRPSYFRFIVRRGRAVPRPHV
jgi:hypothetical protein